MNPIAKSHFDDGLVAFQTNDLNAAIRLFQEGLALEKNEWTYRFYLAMAHAKLGQVREARQEFMSIRDFCTDAELARKASQANAALAGQSAGSVPARKDG